MGIFNDWFEKLAKARAERIAIEQLRAMDDRQLKDIGINRGDIERSVKQE